MANIKKENSKTWSEEAIDTLFNCYLTLFNSHHHMNAYRMLPVVIVKTKTESVCLWKNLISQCKNVTSIDMAIKME